MSPGARTKKPTPASDWSKKPDVVELPSGKSARLRTTAEIVPMLRSGVASFEMLEDYEAAQRGELKEPARAIALQDAMVSWLFVEPRCVLNGSIPEGAIHINDIADEDLDFLVTRAFGGAPGEATFPAADSVPGEPGEPAPGGDGEAVVDEAERAPSAKGRNTARVPDRSPPGGKARGTPRKQRARAARK